MTEYAIARKGDTAKARRIAKRRDEFRGGLSVREYARQNLGGNEQVWNKRSYARNGRKA